MTREWFSFIFWMALTTTALHPDPLPVQGRAKNQEPDPLFQNERRECGAAKFLSTSGIVVLERQSVSWA